MLQVEFLMHLQTFRLFLEMDSYPLVLLLRFLIGGLEIKNYEYSLNGGSTWNAISPEDTTSPVVISGLTNGTNYTVALRAVNAVGVGLSGQVPTIINDLSTTPFTVPAAPSIFSSSAGDGSLTIAFTAGNSGGRLITKYQYSMDGINWYDTNSVINSSVTITGLINGTDYTVRLRAVSEAGNGSSSAPYNDAAGLTTKPFTFPSAPSITTSSSIEKPNSMGSVEMSQDCSNASFSWSNPGAPSPTISVTFSEPANNGRQITDYKYSTDNGQTWKSAGTISSPVTISTVSNSSAALEASTQYNVKLRAVNAGGDGGASSNSARSTPASITSYTIRVFNNRMSISPIDTITNHSTTSYSKNHYHVLADYYISVRAENSGGSGNWNSSSIATGWDTTTCYVNSSSGCSGCGLTTTQCSRYTRSGCNDGDCDLFCGSPSSCSGSWSAFDGSSYTGPVTELLISKSTGGDPRYISFGGYYFASAYSRICEVCDCFNYNNDIYTIEKCNLYPANSTDPAAYRWVSHSCFYSGF